MYILFLVGNYEILSSLHKLACFAIFSLSFLDDVHKFEVILLENMREEIFFCSMMIRVRVPRLSFDFSSFNALPVDR